MTTYSLPTPPSQSAVDSRDGLEKTQDTVVEVKAAPTFPDGGTKAWLAVLGCSLVSFTSYGQLNAFGVFQTYYAEHQLADRSASDISWIGSIQLSAIYFCGLLLGPAMDRYGATVLLVSGWLLSTFCLMMLSLSKTYYQIFLSHGLGFGIGLALQFYPLLVIPAQWFGRKRGLAMGIVVAGANLSGVVFPIMLSRLFQSIGFPWAVRTLGFMCFALQGISIPFIRTRLPPRANAPRFDKTITKDRAFILHALSGFFISFALYTPFWYIELFAVQQGVGTTLTFYLIAIMNAAGLVGRVLLGQLSDLIGTFNITICTLVLGSIATLAIWITSHSSGELVAFAVIYGLSAGSYTSLGAACTTKLTSVPALIGVRVGIFMTAMAPGILTGPSIAGALLSAANGSYIGLQCFVGVMLGLGALSLLSSRLLVNRSVTARI